MSAEEQAVVAGYLQDLARRARKCSATGEEITDRSKLTLLVGSDGLPTGHVFTQAGVEIFREDPSRFTTSIGAGWRLEEVNGESDD